MCKARDPFFFVFLGVFFVVFSRCPRYFRCFLYTCDTGERRFATLAALAIMSSLVIVVRVPLTVVILP